MAATVLALAAAVALGVQMRAADPLSSPVLPAEDSFTHMAMVREHFWDGRLDPINPPGILYPPGLHGYLAAVFVYTGIELYDVIRFGPIFLGALGIVGIAFLLWRSDGPFAAVIGALGAALAPEVIVRTTMMAPTALDLAITPFFLYSLLAVLRGRIAWAGVAAPMALFLVFAHPWLLTILALAGFVFMLLAFLFPWTPDRGAPLTARGLATAIAIVGVAWGLSISGCWGSCGSSFRDIMPEGEKLMGYAPIATGAAVFACALVLASARWLDRFLARRVKPFPTNHRILVSFLIGAIVVLGTIPAIDAGMPQYVNLPRMFGAPILALAFIGLVAVPLIRSPAGHLGAGIVAATYPFVIYNPLHSDFWPHRTAVYLGLGVFLLAGVVGGFVARLATHTLTSPALRPTGWSPRTFVGPSTRRDVHPMLAMIPALLFIGSLGGAVYAGTPDGDSHRWYRLFDECEFSGLAELADRAKLEPSGVVITGSWQAKLVVAALSTNATRIWYKGDFYSDRGEREAFVSGWSHTGLPLYVVMDKYLHGDSSFLKDTSRWNLVGAYCGPPGGANATLWVYELKKEGR